MKAGWPNSRSTGPRTAPCASASGPGKPQPHRSPAECGLPDAHQPTQRHRLAAEKVGLTDPPALGQGHQGRGHVVDVSEREAAVRRPGDRGHTAAHVQPGHDAERGMIAQPDDLRRACHDHGFSGLLMPPGQSVRLRLGCLVDRKLGAAPFERLIRDDPAGVPQGGCGRGVDGAPHAGLGRQAQGVFGPIDIDGSHRAIPAARDAQLVPAGVVEEDLRAGDLQRGRHAFPVGDVPKQQAGSLRRQLACHRAVRTAGHDVDLPAARQRRRGQSPPDEAGPPGDQDAHVPPPTVNSSCRRNPRLSCGPRCEPGRRL